ERYELAAELSADRTARTGDQHRASRRKSAHSFEVRLDRRAAQQVFDLNLAQRGDAHSAIENLEQPRDGACAKASLISGAYDFAHHTAGRAWHRDDELRGALTLGHFADLLERSQHAQAAQSQAQFGGIVVDESHGCQT